MLFKRTEETKHGVIQVDDDENEHGDEPSASTRGIRLDIRLKN
jgi:hypothetical protein